MQTDPPSKLVISLGGSILVRGERDEEFLKDVMALLRMISGKMKVIAVVGGGRTARDHIRLARSLGSDEASLDAIGILATRLNASLLVSGLRDICYPRPFESIDEALAALASFRVVVGGGTHPGHTTDTVAALLAERWGADLFLNLTSVDGAYTSDPSIDPEAKRIDMMTSSELLSLVESTERIAGSHSPMDPLAARIVHRARIPTFILHGRDLKAISECISGNVFPGTRVVPGGVD